MRKAITVAAALLTTSAYLLPGTALAAGGHAHDEDLSKGAISSYRELTEDEATIQAVLDTYGRAMEEKSIAVMEQAVIPGDFSTIESGYANWTWEDFRDNHLAVEMEQFGDVSFDIGLVLGEFQGDLGFAIFNYTAAGEVAGNAISISGLGTAILENTAAGWRIHHMHTSAPRSQLQQAEQDMGGHGSGGHDSNGHGHGG